tara:strand:+ start:2316 stop:3143 length:828 start_codon:yes stop_codon:yes gene_type:complete
VTNTIAKIVRRARSNFFWSFVFLDDAKRQAIFAAYAFARNTDDIVDETESPEEAKRLLAEWRADLDACYSGSPHSDITKALQPVVTRYQIPKAHFEALIDGVEMDLTITRYRTLEELRTYCYRVASAVGLICIEIFGYECEQTKDYAVNLGLALQLTNILRDVGEDAARGRIYLPLEDLEQFGYSEQQLLSGTMADGFQDLMVHTCSRAKSYYQRAADALTDTDRAAMFPAETMGQIYADLLRRIEVRGFPVLNERVSVPTTRKVYIAARNWIRR